MYFFLYVRYITKLEKGNKTFALYPPIEYCIDSTIRAGYTVLGIERANIHKISMSSLHGKESSELF